MAGVKGRSGGARKGAGRPKGREDKVLTQLKRARADLREEAKGHADKALRKIVKLIDSDDQRVALMASETILDRAYGKATQYTAQEKPEETMTDAELAAYLDAVRLELASRGGIEGDREALSGGTRTTH